MAIRVNTNHSLTGKVDLAADHSNAIIAQRQDLGNGAWAIHIVPDGWVLSDYHPGQYTTLGIPGTTPRCEGALPELPLKKPEKLIKRAYSMAGGTIPNIPVDEWGQAIMRDPYLSPPEKAVVAGLPYAAAASRGSKIVSIGDVVKEQTFDGKKPEVGDELVYMDIPDAIKLSLPFVKDLELLERTGEMIEYTLFDVMEIAGIIKKEK